jgi:hypothetical protein
VIKNHGKTITQKYVNGGKEVVGAEELIVITRLSFFRALTYIVHRKFLGLQEILVIYVKKNLEL